MWRRSALIVALAVVHELASQGAGQQRAEETHLLARQKWVRFDIVLGRITATHLRGGKGPRVREAGDERVTIDGDALHPSVRYEQVGSQRTILIEMINRDQVEILVTSADEPQPVVHLRQQPNKPLALEVVEGGAQRTCRADSFWHLMLGKPEICRSHLLPLMALLRTDWHLEETAARIEAALFQTATGGPSVDPEQVTSLVEQLRSSSFAERQEADRTLRRLGVSILPQLRQIDPAALNEEQRMRLRRIEDHLAAPAADSASRVAAWLANDKAIWLDLLMHREPAMREAAANRLTGIHSGPIHFDPFAEEIRRNQQIARLRRQLADY